MLSRLGLHAEPVPAVPDSCLIFPSQQKLSSQVTVEMPVLPLRQHRVRGRAAGSTPGWDEPHAAAAASLDTSKPKVWCVESLPC